MLLVPRGNGIPSVKDLLFAACRPIQVIGNQLDGTQGGQTFRWQQICAYRPTVIQGRHHILVILTQKKMHKLEGRLPIVAPLDESYCIKDCTGSFLWIGDAQTCPALDIGLRRFFLTEADGEGPISNQAIGVR